MDVDASARRIARASPDASPTGGVQRVDVACGRTVSHSDSGRRPRTDGVNDARHGDAIGGANGGAGGVAEAMSRRARRRSVERRTDADDGDGCATTERCRGVVVDDITSRTRWRARVGDAGDDVLLERGTKGVL